MITKRLLIWIIMLLAVYWAIIEFGYDALFFVLAVQIILPIMSLISLVISIRRVDIKLYPAQSVVDRKEMSVVEMELNNKSRLMMPFVSISGSWHNSDGKKTVNRKIVSVKARSSITSAFSLLAEHCGIQTFNLIKIAARDQFGFFYLPLRSREWCSNNKYKITVIPRSRPAEYSWSNSSSWDLDTSINNQNVSPEIDILANLRDYRPGDSLKRIHWKISARLHTLMTKEFEDPSSRYIMFSFDPQKPAAGNNYDNLDKLLETAAAAMKVFLENGHQIKWLDAGFEWQFREASRPDQIDLLRQSISQYSWGNFNWSEYLAIRLERMQAELVVLIAWNLDASIKTWIKGYLNDKGHIMLLWLRSEALKKESAEGMEWEELIESGMQGYIVNTVASE